MAEDRRDWSLMTKARNGNVSILRDMTLAECRAIYERLDPWFGLWREPPTTQEIDGIKWSMGGGVSRLSEPGDIEIREVFGPPDWDPNEIRSWERWPKMREPDAALSPHSNKHGRMTRLERDPRPSRSHPND